MNERVRWLIVLHLGGLFTLAALQPPSVEPPSPRCARCGGVMSLLGFAPAVSPAVFDTAYGLAGRIGAVSLIGTSFGSTWP